MVHFKLLSGEIKHTLVCGNYSMTLKVLENNSVFVEVKHVDGNVSASLSEIIEMEYNFSSIVNYGDVILRHYSAQPEPVRQVLFDTILAMKHI